MLSSYVCRQCRVRLARRVAPTRNLQWQPRATFISLRNQQPQDGTEPADTTAQPQTQQNNASDHSQNEPRIRYTSHLQGNDSPQRTGRYSRHIDEPSENTEQPAKQSFIKRDPSERMSDTTEAGDQGTSYIKPIEKQLKKGNVGEAWSLFEKTYTSSDCKAFTEPSLSDVPELRSGRFFLTLLSTVNKAFCTGTAEPSVTPTTVLFKYEQLGIARPEYWTRQTLAYLTHNATIAVNGLSTELQRDLPSLLFELLSVWRLFFQCKGQKSDPLETISTEWPISVTSESFHELHESRDFSLRLQEYHPKYIGNPTLGFCAIYLYNLSEALEASDSLKEQAAPFMNLLTHLLAGSKVNPVFKHTQTSREFGSYSEELQKQIMAEINLAPQRAMINVGSHGAPKEGNNGDPQSSLEQFHLKRIERAVESRASAATLDSLWTQVEKGYVTESGKPEIPIRLYNAFLSGYLVLLSAQRSVQVWNHMVAHGVKPDLATWVALLEGCEKAKDLDGFNAMWSRMLSSGVEPDTYAWTTRVHGLVALRQLNVAMKTLDDMGNKWLSAEAVIKTPQTHSKRSKAVQNLPASAKAVNNCTKPSVEVVNGAISALVQLPLPDRGGMRLVTRIEHVQKLLRWASNFEIKPDARTYNGLMQLYLRAGDFKTAYRVLGQMDKAGIDGDVATYTMLITAGFDRNAYDGLSESQQTERILGLLNELESSGLKLNGFVYATAIDRLLKQYSNYTAVRAIIDTMEARKIAISAHVYTSLITYYFQHSPPLISSVDSLVNQIFTSHRMPSDRYLFDRTIEGYAEFGEVGKMMSVLTRMSKHRKQPGWQAITAAVRALVQAGDMESARLVVRDVERGQGVAQGGITGSTRAERQFFGIVKGLGLELEEERMGDSIRNQKVDIQQEFAEAREQDVLHEVGRESGNVEREPDNVAAGEKEEEVYGFLTDEPESQPQRG
ncbi:hypothetical protein P153DRAFT_326334 [Dothidotthia symphoricarpi CBS 119687]|uniref:Pentacotripeptide-repeat region of PRORP domain-containing protein n=1 Tax=Dothidotthia symphoricarpi CBS 119687 TaxID=1392245 RepID=A0A6A5ZZY6_9PLEO|nr:uncharacterized protein P153DRAFT_326334 [Dothidotthia symphoricarpi CBS 119687]KAF2124846.1 hypothetical protein P153DRAFT_326334 [Dothidotthia symphoricarpi CBS 119687]